MRRQREGRPSQVEETAYLARLFIVHLKKIRLRNQPTDDRDGGISHIPRFRHHCFLFQKAEIRS
ncbi:hypothetical protein OAE68_01140 [Synechococcus sp. AH-551-A10]|nr:hypothetical protein [Synechococcus sp. AH-551-A10]